MEACTVLKVSAWLVAAAAAAGIATAALAVPGGGAAPARAAQGSVGREK